MDARPARTDGHPLAGTAPLRRILAVRLDNVGDVVMLGPALRAVRAAFPSASMTLLCSPAGGRAAPMLPWVDHVLVHRAVWQDASGTMPLDPERELALVETLRRGSFDAALIFTSFSQSPYPPAQLCYLAGIPIRAGQTDEFGGSVLAPAIEAAPWAAHQVDRNLRLVERLGIPDQGRELELHVPPAADAGATVLLADNGVDPEAPFIVLAPGASCSARRYDPARYGRVAGRLAEETGAPIVVVGNEREHGVAREVADAAGQAKRLVSLVGRTSIPELAAVIRRSALLVGNDSGPMHLADAFGTPIVVTFSGTDLESQWRPRRSPVALLRVPTPCAPCYRFTCPYDNACLDIPPDRVVAEALRLLATRFGAVKADRHRTPLPSPIELSDGGLDAPADPHLARPRKLPVLPGAGAP